MPNATGGGLAQGLRRRGIVQRRDHRRGQGGIITHGHKPPETPIRQYLARAAAAIGGDDWRAVTHRLDEHVPEPTSRTRVSARDC